MTPLGVAGRVRTRTLGSVTAYISSGKTTHKDAHGKYPLYGSTGPIGVTNRVEFSGPSILVARVGANAGSVYRVDGQYGVTDNTLVVRPKADQDVAFLAECLLYANLNRFVYGSGQPLVTGSMLKSFEVPDLSLTEQLRIAEALEDANGLIDSLERLITKKQAIKQGMMQELLTGRTQLPGFTRPWKTTRLGDVLAVRHGKSQRGIELPSGRFPILATGGQIGWTDTPLYNKPSVLIGRKGTIDRPQYQERPFWTIDTLFYTEIASSADPKFLYYVFLTIDWRSLNEASGVPSLSASRVESLSVELPGIDEQKAIRSVLDDAEEDLRMLNLRVNKARDVKQGMMQELLTGRTRLPVEEAVA